MMELEQKAIIVGVNLNNQYNFDYSMEELAIWQWLVKWKWLVN